MYELLLMKILLSRIMLSLYHLCNEFSIRVTVIDLRSQLLSFSSETF